MKRTCLLTLLSVIAFRLVATAFGPVQLSGQLVDTDLKPVAYASIGVVNTPVGTVADEQGRFLLYVTDNVKLTDTVRISLIGYQTLSLPVSALTQRLTASQQLILHQDVRVLSEVRINATDSKVKTQGKKGYQTKMATNFALNELPRQNLGAEIGRKFNVSRGLNRFDKYQFYIISTYDTVRFRVNVYRANDMQNLLPQNIYVTVAGKARKWVVVDLLPYQLVTSDDVLISVQWIDNSQTGTAALQMPLQMPAVATHYYRYGSQDRWKKFRGMTTSMNLTFTRSRT